MYSKLKTSAEWQEDSGITIIDPDGWDRNNFQYSWFEEKITKDEFLKRTFISTIKIKSDI